MELSRIMAEQKAKGILHSLRGRDALAILLELCEDEALEAEILLRARKILSDVDSSEIAERIFHSLNGIDVEDLWTNSGDTYSGMFLLWKRHIA
jgi:hypothetical protein